MRMGDSGDPFYLSAEETRLTRLVCPACNGSLAQVDLSTISYYRCHVGHQWSPETLSEAQAEMTDKDLWTAVSSLEEQAAFSRHLAAHHADDATQVNRLHNADRATHLAQLIRRHLDGSPPDDRGHETH